MKPLERFPPDDPHEGVSRARGNRVKARDRMAEIHFEDLCFEAQQAAEKTIKAVMIKRRIDFPYSMASHGCFSRWNPEDLPLRHT